MRVADENFEVAYSGLDPNVSELERAGCQLSGHEAACFLPSTTSAALCALASMDIRGKQVIMEPRSHIRWLQRSHPSAYSGGAALLLPGDKFGAIDLQLLEQEMSRTAFGVRLDTGVVCLENTHNMCGGTVLPPAYLVQVSALAHRHGARLFIDGARLFNAAVALGVPVSALAQPADAIVMSLNKAVGAPYGALLCGAKELVDRARAEAMRIGANQVHKSGILAAAALVALEDVDVRAKADHSRARRLSEGLQNLPGIRIDMATVQTNLVKIETAEDGIGAHDLVGLLAEHGVGLTEINPTAIRAVTHGSITDDSVERAIEIFAMVLQAQPSSRSGKRLNGFS